MISYEGIYEEIRKIQGNNSLISLTKIFNQALNELDYPLLNYLIIYKGNRAARQYISNSLKARGYTKYNTGSSYHCKAVWIEPEVKKNETGNLH